MTERSYRKLQAVDEAVIEHDSHDVDIESPTDSIYDGCARSSDGEDPETGPCRTSDSSEATGPTEISIDQGDPAREPEALHQDMPQGALQNACMPSPNMEDPQAGPHRGSHSSEPTACTDISVDEGHPTTEPDAPHQHAPFLCDLADARSSNSQEQISHNELGIGSQRPALEKPAEQQPPRWTMLYFHLLFLVPFSIFLILMLAALEALYHISQHKQGLMTASEAMHYAWTYGPTFVLTMIAALWGQLEQCAKQIMPWSIMCRGKAIAAHGLMLNYITSSMPGSLFRSLKRRHFLVSLGISGSLVLRLMLIFSSGLLRLEYRPVSSMRNLSLRDTIDLTKNVSHSYWDNVRTALDYWSITKYGLSYPSGVTSQFAVQAFVASDDDVYEELNGEVQVFESSLEGCDTFKFTYTMPADTYDPSMPPPDSVLEKLRPWCYADLYGIWDTGNSVATYLIGGQTTNLTQLVYKCTNSTSIEEQDHRILITAESWLSSNESEVIGYMCEPRYTLTRRTVSNITRDVSLQDNLNVSGAIAEILNVGVRPFNMTQKILDSLDGENAAEILDFEWNLWFTLLNLTQPQKDLSSFRNTSLVIELSKRMWPGLAAFVVKHDYTSLSNQTINGTTISTQGRLCVQELPLRLLEALISVLLIFSAALCFLRPGVFNRDPTSLGAHAMILARSPDLMALLDGSGAASKDYLRAILSGCLASYPQHSPPESLAIEIQQHRKGPEKPAEDATADNSDTRQWWSPMSVRWWFRLCILTATLGVMIVLEVLLQISARGNGLGNASLDGYLKYTWSLLPTFVLALIGLLFSMVDSTARTLHPFKLLLRQGRARLADILHDPARQVSLIAVARAAWKGHFVLLLAILPGLLGPILTIITSGLYTVVPVPWTYNTDLKLKDWFRPENRTIYVGSTNNVEGDNHEAWTVFTLTQFSNMSYPGWTQGEYALSSFGADNLHNYDGNNTSLYVTARIPASRAKPNCSLIGQFASDSFQTLEDTVNYPSRTRQWLPIDPRPLGCVTSPEWNRTTGQRDLYLRKWDTINFYDDGYYLAQFSDEYDSLVQLRNNQSTQSTTSITVCGNGRQHYLIGLGHDEEALSVLHCVPYVESLWVSATFTLPHLSLATDVPLAPDASSSVFLSDSASMTAISIENWDGIFSAVVNGSSGVGQLAGLMPGPDDDDAHQLIAALENPVAKYLALNLHFNYRHPLDGNYTDSSTSTPGRDLFIAHGHPATANVTDDTRLRVTQSAVSTRILQGLLGVMAVCLITESALGRGARIIPRDPGSVASRMAFFAGGALWRNVPVGADRWRDEGIRRWGREVSEGKLLLGWWGGDDRECPEDGPRPSVKRARRFAVDSLGRKAVV